MYFDGKLASQAYLIESEKEDFFNFINDKKFSKYNLSSIILDQIFRKKKTLKKKDFNFHGSNISEIAEFYRRFGAEENYAFVENSKIQLFKSYFIRQ